MPETALAVLEAVAAATPSVAAVVDAEGAVLWLNPAFLTHWKCGGATSAEAMLDLVHPADRDRIHDAWRAARTGGHRITVRRTRLAVEGAYVDGRVRLIRVESGALDGSVVVAIEMDSESHRQLTMDPLTGLVNRQGLLDDLDIALATGGDAALLVLDIVGFRALNEVYGPRAGDQVLVTIGRRLRQAAHECDVVARVGADEFAVLCAHDEPDSPQVATSLREALRRPVEVAGGGSVLDCQIGVVRLDAVRDSIDALSAADAALYVARSRKTWVEEFTTGLRESVQFTLRRTSEVRAAVANGEFRLRFQPIVDIASDATIGCEALLRWQHPLDGELGPTEFLDLLESSGLIAQLTGRLVDEACVAAAALAERWEGEEPPYVSVNLSARQLTDPTLVPRITDALRRQQLSPRQLMVEITEHAVLTDVSAAVEALRALRDLGVRIALDDFGTGFSSLLRLRELPVDCLKIDRTFVAGMTGRREDLAIVASVVNMAATLGLDCIAEGVETRDQARQLSRLGCSSAQGFLWSPAVAVTGLRASWADAAAARRGPRETETAAPTATAAWILELHRGGASLHSIAAILNQSGSRTERGTQWRAHTVARVISRAAYPDLDA